MKIVQRPSPNQNARPCAVDCVVLHATADHDTAGSLAWCCDPKAKVSYHTLVDRDGTVYALVPIARRAWHAGVSAFEGRPNCNDYSIGLSFANANDGVEPYTDAQYEVGAALVAAYMRQYPAITYQRITTHAAVALPAGRKTDPLKFNVTRLLTLVARELAQAAA